MTMFYGGPGYQCDTVCTQHDARTWFVRSSRRDFSYWRREDSQFGSRNKYVTIWPQSGFMSGDRLPGYCQIGQDMCERDDWSPMQKASRGTSSSKFIQGTCKDELGNPLSGAVVQGFLTANDRYVGEVTSDPSGNYELGTVYPNQNHYLVAYYASGNKAGTTVNTLVPTNRDGT